MSPRQAEIAATGRWSDLDADGHLRNTGFSVLATEARLLSAPRTPEFELLLEQ